MDYIFIIGPSAVGKTTLAKALFQHYKGAYIEQNMVPEFTVPEGIHDVGLYEEEVCWENVLLQLKFFYEKRIRNIIALDFDDIRARELPIHFQGYKFITIKLVSSDTEQIKRQMEYRKSNEGGLYIPEYVDRSNEVIMKRKLLPNEVQIDIAGKTKEQILEEAINLIDNFVPLQKCEYQLDNSLKYLSWVKSRNLY